MGTLNTFASLSKVARMTAPALAILVLLAATPVAGLAQKKKPAASKPATPAYKYAYEYGYRAGYEDGYKQGKADVGQAAMTDFTQNDLYNRADRTYQDRMGPQLEFQEGYRLGFGLAYTDGYFGRAYTTALPANLSKVVSAKLNVAGVTPSDNRGSTAQGDTGTFSDSGSGSRSGSATGSGSASGSGSGSGSGPASGSASGTGSGGGGRLGRTSSLGRVPDGIEMKIRLQDRISTKTSREGDQFNAVVIDPRDYSEAQIVGHIAKLKKAGDIKGKTELLLSFDTLTLRNGQTMPMAAQMVKVYGVESVKQTDDEGNVQTSDRSKDTIIRTGGGGALGAIIGGIAGGGMGAGIGAAIGAGAGIASVYIDGGKNLQLEPGTEMLIRTSAPK